MKEVSVCVFRRGRIDACMRGLSYILQTVGELLSKEVKVGSGWFLSASFFKKKKSLSFFSALLQEPPPPPHTHTDTPPHLTAEVSCDYLSVCF